MPTRGRLPRVLLGVGLVGGGALAVVGGLALRGPGLVAVGLAGVLAASVAAGMARDSPAGTTRSTVESAIQAAAWTAGALLALSGTATLAGGAVAALLAGGCVIAALAVWLVRAGRPGPRAAGTVHRGSVGPLGGDPGGTVRSAPAPATSAAGRTDPAVAGTARLLPPVSGLTTRALGREWVRTTAALAGRMEPAARQSIVGRRQETLDELEQRDPVGFARWLATGPEPGSDPADYLQDEPAAGTDAA